MQLPEWARSAAPERIDGPFVVVRRVAESSDPSTLPTLGMALVRNKGGTVELSDEGPLFVDDLRLPGDSRLIRARPGYRPIIWIQEPSLEVVRSQPGAFTLDHKNLILDGLDLIVNARDLSTRPTALMAAPRQPALFSCNGANLTLRNCSITILNQAGGGAFTFVRADSSASRPTRILLERTLVRGGFTSGIDVTGGSAEVVLHKSMMIGGAGPLIRFADSDKAPEHRLYLVDSILSGPGPIIERLTSTSGTRPRPLPLRAFGTAFGRFHGAGIASVISAPDATAGADKLIDWNGNDNLFAGWKGFFACGKEPTVTVADLAAVRSTWSATEQGSQEVLSTWPLPRYLASAVPQDLAPFLPNQGAILRQVAAPRAGLFEKTVDEYPTPMIPQATGWAVDRQVPPNPNGRRAGRATIAIAPSNENAPNDRSPGPGNARSPGDQSAIETLVELTFDTGTEPWNGDLGAFLRDRLAEGTQRARVRVTGAGSHYFTAVRLPVGIWLELAVTPAVGGELPSWSPQPQSTGAALIELEQGALVLSNFILRSEESAHYDQLIHVQDGHLIVSQCQLIGRKSAGNFVGDLIGFRAVTTERKSSEFSQLIFTGIIDRPVCRIVDSTLITDGTALKSEVGRGLIALNQCAVAAGIAAIELNPAKVARARFDVDLWVDHCTLISDRTIVRLGAWPGLSPGPDRPCLITTRNCAFLAMSDRRPRETVLLRSDADALARGTVFWQGSDDVIDLDLFIAAGEGEPSSNGRPRDIQHQWVDFWGANHIKRVSGPGPRGTGKGPWVRFRTKLRPGRVEPVDLILDPDYHPGSDRLTVGAFLQRQGFTPSTARTGRDRSGNPSGRAPVGGAPPF